jgi:hypothetical protein
LLTIHAWFTSNKLGRIVSKEERWVELHERWKKRNQSLTKLLIVQEIMWEKY